jgi:hypothetical protein
MASTNAFNRCVREHVLACGSFRDLTCSGIPVSAMWPQILAT